MIKYLLTFTLAFFNIIYGIAQITKIREGLISPMGNKIALICYSGAIEDLYVYNIESDLLFRITNSQNLPIGLQYKTSMNWVDNEKILFLSKQSGIVQQYILDLENNSLTNNGESESNEYDLKYSGNNKESYYISSINGNEPAVFRRKSGENKATKISKLNVNHIISSVSNNGDYISYKEMPVGKPIIYSLHENKQLKLNLPPKNTNIISWSPNSRKFLYTHANYVSVDKPLFSLSTYDLETNQNTVILDNVEFIWSACWSESENLIAYSVNNKLIVQNLTTGTKDEQTMSVNSIEWFPGNKALLLIEDNKAFIYNLETKISSGIIK